ncbi:hypothetical protein KHP62_14475 [Rhodobacteraceae bacterium NNCM2]|nr:hypothetical protein [Coraliihabitans acroporae]
MFDLAEQPLDLTEWLAPRRVHEATGPGARAFAARLAGALAGPVIWLQQASTRDQLCPQGLAAFFDPARLIVVRPPDRLALLQSMEEVLRSGAAPLAVAEIARAPDLTESRRLQLAAGTGKGRGLCLISEAQTNAAETRWECAQAYSPSGAPLQRWQLVKNKRGALGQWEVA